MRPGAEVALTFAMALLAAGLKSLILPDFPVNPDVSWIGLVAAEMARGARLYVDFDDPNLPFAFLSMLPAAWAGAGLGIATNTAIHLWVLALATISALLAARSLRRAALAPTHRLALTAGFLFLAIPGPANDFGQREHLCFILLYPALVFFALRRTLAPAGIGAHLLPALLAALAVAIKPHLVLCLVVPGAYALWRDRSDAGILRFFAALVLGSAGLALVAWPYYLDYMTNLSARLLYFQYHRMSVTIVLVLGLVALAALDGWRNRGRGGAAAELQRILLLAALGAAAAFLVQWKGWLYHGLPAVFFACLSLIAGLLPKVTAAASRAQALAGLVPCAFLLFYPAFDLNTYRDYSAYLRPILQLTDGPAAVLSFNIDQAFPAASEHEGGWAMRYPGLYALPVLVARRPPTQDAPYMPASATEAAYRDAIVADLIDRGATLLVFPDQGNHYPDQPPFIREWLATSPDFQAFLAGFDRVPNAAGHWVYLRRDG